MERGTTLWLGGGAVALIAVVGLGFWLSSEPAAPPAPVPGPTTAAAPVPGVIPADARRPEEQPTPVPEDAWVTTASGLKYADLVVGTGNEVVAGAGVSIEYTGWAPDGSVFDSSKRRARPLWITYGRGDAPLPGWEEALAGMRGGGKRVAVFPPELAYGQAGRPPRIPGDATVTFEFEVKQVMLQREAPTAPPPVPSDATVTAENVRYADLVTGTGRTLQTGDVVAVDYTGFLENGTKFDSSLDRPNPTRFTWGVGEMLAGFDKGLVGMKVGGRRVLVVPPELGFGVTGRRGFVPPNETLTFDVTLVEAAAP
jgi:peptidylprolyl isomerase